MAEKGVSVRAAYQMSLAALMQAGIEDAASNAIWIWCGVLEMSRPQFMLYCTDSEARISVEQEQHIQKLVARRCRHEPLQYLLGNVDFLEWTFVVAPGVLIPRPETELLTEKAIELMRPKEKSVIIDYCTGSGCIGLSLALALPHAAVYGIDISEEALTIAKRNCVMHGLEKRVTLLKGDSLAVAKDFCKVDCIISNPPYIPSAEIAALQPEIVQHEPLLALDGGADGLIFYRYFADHAADYLNDDGVLLAEFGDNQEASIVEIFRQSPHRWLSPAFHRDNAGKYRFFTVKKKK